MARQVNTNDDRKPLTFCDRYHAQFINLSESRDTIVVGRREYTIANQSLIRVVAVRLSIQRTMWIYQWLCEGHGKVQPCGESKHVMMRCRCVRVLPVVFLMVLRKSQVTRNLC